MWVFCVCLRIWVFRRGITAQIDSVEPGFSTRQALYSLFLSCPLTCGVSVVIYAGFGAEYAVSVCANGLQWVSSTPNFRTLRAEIAAKVTLTHEKEGSDGTRRHY